MNNDNKNVGIIVQAILSVATIAMAVLYFFEHRVLLALKIMMALFMFLNAYNNHFVFKRPKWYTVTYIVVGLLIVGAIFF